MLRFLVLTIAIAFSNEEESRPVTKVVNLLKDMQKQLEKEAEEDQTVYDKMACWCTTNDKEKTQSIKNAEQTIAQLTGDIEEFSAASARLNTEIKGLSDEVAANTEALNQADEIRQKQLAEFNAEEKDMLQAVAALKAAITVLSKHHEPSLLQAPDDAMLHAATVLRRSMLKYPRVTSSLITPAQKKIVDAFIQAPAGFQSYAPQSSQIYGILKQMRENFAANLAASQKDEEANQKAFDELKVAKEAEIQNGQEQVDKKTTRLADTNENLAQAKQQLDDTKKSLSADEQFLMDLKEKCQLTDQEWDARQKKRQDEITAVSQALNVLSGDDAHDTFSRTFSFVQVNSNRQEAADVLQKAAVKFNDPKLSALATKVRLDAFTKVKEAIDGMIAILLKEKDDEVKTRDFCIKSLDENERQTTKTNRDHRDVKGKIEQLTQNIENLAKTIDELNAEIKELNNQLQLAGEEREAQNKEYQTTVRDQRDTRALLQKALKHLEAFYSKKSFLQQPAPAGFKGYENNAGGNTVLNLLNQIITDTKTLEAEAQRAEDDTQKAYEGFVAETNRSVETKTKGSINAEENKAKKEVERSEAQEEREGLQFKLDELANAEADFHKSCDFVLKNFEVRQEAREQEVQSLRQAKDILSGANFGFLQKH
eukprot:GEMP01018913.1.p1 GENE.GEMP01018913.1~~GEMP01018913.1.p1  ORF type:complete len:653 (-),score=219.28 GEMP01018913.1:660-2618(-)